MKKQQQLDKNKENCIKYKRHENVGAVERERERESYSLFNMENI